MQFTLGIKIRELRHRDGRTQEALAEALSVTSQAVSRWESGGSYPDIELLPSIANYFNVSIDELFGYSRERESKLKDILEKADRALNEQENMTECVEMLRAAANEFPSEPQILIRLGYALSQQGWKKYGARSYTKEDSDYVHDDTGYNCDNIYWQEEIKVFEKVLSMDISADDRDVINMMLVIVYTQMGYSDKAKVLAKKQNSIIACREMLLPKAAEAEERDRYQGEAIIALLTELKNVIINSVNNNVSMARNPIGETLLLELARFYEAVFSDGRYGIAHTHLRELYIEAAIIEARLDADSEKAFEYFRKAFEHNKAYESIRCGGEYKYTAPLVSKVTFPSENFPSAPDDFWKTCLIILPDKLKNRIKSDPQFTECF